VTALQGECLVVSERMIVAPEGGVFRLSPKTSRVEHGTEIGVLEMPGSVTPIRSPFAGELMGFLAHDGERLRAGQPVAWLRVA
jgi:hypothetical protein